ncbi:RHS repeat domain-containing protein [Cupriavidus sp. USMAHM13]|uniref:RHS repeat domain-containing protein n=1 Tax=Cupriavidus sp. USMAHM13 TaxID=1389192 RepID=UPI0018D2B3BB|nr:RHS repeat domain-containing protein [Cupriavidus sp. USMAHM13]
MQGFVESSRGQSIKQSGAVQAGTTRARRLNLRFALHFALGAAIFALSPLAHSANSVEYTYDPLGRLAKVVYNVGNKKTTITYSYDAAGNRTSVVSTSP